MVCVVWLSDHSLTCVYRSYIEISGLIITTNAIRCLNYSFTIAAKILSLSLFQVGLLLISLKYSENNPRHDAIRVCNFPGALGSDRLLVTIYHSMRSASCGTLAVR